MRLIGALALLGALTACSSPVDASPAIDVTAPTQAVGPAPATQASTQPSNPTPRPTVTPEPAPTPNLSVFIAAVNEGLSDTAYEDAALADPEVFLAVGQLFCELLADGLTVDGILAEYLSALEDPVDGSVTDDDALVSGVLMGASLEVLCPEQQKSD
jgi:hypothetical protein